MAHFKKKKQKKNKEFNQYVLNECEISLFVVGRQVSK